IILIGLYLTIIYIDQGALMQTLDIISTSQNYFDLHSCTFKDKASPEAIRRTMKFKFSNFSDSLLCQLRSDIGISFGCNVSAILDNDLFDHLIIASIENVEPSLATSNRIESIV